MKIDEFEFRNKQGQEIEPTKNQLVIYIKSLHKEIKELKQQLTITEKALELAVGLIFEEYGCSKFDDKTCKKGDNSKVCYQCLKEEYLQRAKEMLEDE